MKNVPGSKRHPSKPEDITYEVLQDCADYLAKIIVGDPKKYGCLTVMHDRFEHEMEMMDSHARKLDRLRMRVQELEKAGK